MSRMMMKCGWFVLLMAALLAVSSLDAVQRTIARSEGASDGRKLSNHGDNTADTVQVTSVYSKFRHRTWVTGSGRVKRILEDDLDPPCHQRFILEDESGHTILVAHNIDQSSRVQGLEIGDVIAFKGEFINNSRGGLVHWTHSDETHRRPGGWLKKIASGSTSFAEEEIAPLPDTCAAETDHMDAR